MPLSIRLPDEINERLDFLARQTGRTKAFYIREALAEMIDDLEDYYLAADSLNVSAREKSLLFLRPK